jgi:hypothetical protein
MRARLPVRVSGIAVAVALSMSLVGGATAAADEQRSDVCLEIVADSLPDGAWTQVIEAVDEVVSGRPDLFPTPVWSVTLSGQTQRIDYVARGDVAEDAGPVTDCLAGGADWTVRVGRAFLDAGADRMLELGPTTPGIESSVDVEWFPGEDRVTTTLVFAGPLDIPNGTCWIDDTLGVDGATASAISIVEHGVQTSLFAESACGRFFDHLDKGGAGEQAITLLPTSLTLPVSSTLQLTVEDVTVEDDGIVISGSVGVDALP